MGLSYYQKKVRRLLGDDFNFQIDTPHGGKPEHVDLTSRFMGGADKIEVDRDGNIIGGSVRYGKAKINYSDYINNDNDKDKCGDSAYSYINNYNNNKEPNYLDYKNKYGDSAYFRYNMDNYYYSANLKLLQNSKEEMEQRRRRGEFENQLKIIQNAPSGYEVRPPSIGTYPQCGDFMLTPWYGGSYAAAQDYVRSLLR